MPTEMKKIYLFLLMILAVGFVACDDELDGIKFQEENSFIAFESRMASIGEDSDGVLELVVNLSTTTPKAITVDFDFSTEGIDNPAQVGTHFELLNDSKTLTFAKGEYTQTIRIKAIDNDVRDLDKLVVVKLTANSIGLPLGVADGKNSELTLTVADNEHPLALILGSYNEDDFVLKDGSLDGSYDITISQDEDDETVVWINNFWGGGDYNIKAVVDLANKTMTILPGQIIYQHDDYGDFKVVRIDLDAGAYDPESGIVCSIDDQGNITTEAWSASVGADSYGLYIKSVLTKK